MYNCAVTERDAKHSSGGLSPLATTWLGLVINLALATAKVLAGVLCSSRIILVDGLHSASDLITDVAVLAALRVSRKPADRNHPYGHRRFATLVAMFVGALLLAGGVVIGVGAIQTLHGPSVISLVSSPVPLLLALATVAMKEGLFRITRRVGQRSGNAAITANAWHHRSDAFSSVAAAAGLAAVAAGGAGWAFLDPVVALILAAFLAMTAVRIIRTSASELVDSAPGAATLDTIERAVAETRGVAGYHAFRARRVGGKIAVDVHVQVDPELTVRDGHAIASAVRRQVVGADRTVIETIVHIEPADQAVPARR